jgi:putative addiction module component (TIGR02574 family)
LHRIRGRGRYRPEWLCEARSALRFRKAFPYAREMELLTHDELMRLTPPERLAMISQLWDSLEDEQLPLTAAQQDELDRRLATLESDRREGVTWDALKAELESRCP